MGAEFFDQLLFCCLIQHRKKLISIVVVLGAEPQTMANECFNDLKSSGFYKNEQEIAC
jgi:hypothetical protein